MNRALLRKKLSADPIEDYNSIVFSHVSYDDKLPIVHVMSMTEALRQRRRDVLAITILTKKAKQTLEKIERKV